MSANSIPRQDFTAVMHRLRFQRGLAFGAILIAALALFEMFNYSTTEYALTDLLGDLQFIGIPWATILALAFCGIDFAGIARLHTPEEGTSQSSETWYLFGAWLLAATMNAMLTWWGVSLAILNNSSIGAEVLERSTLLHVVPIFVAILVWLIRVLIIGTYSIAGTRLFTQREQRPIYTVRPGSLQPQQPLNTQSNPNSTTPTTISTTSPISYRSGGKVADRDYRTSPRQDPTISNSSIQTSSRSIHSPNQTAINSNLDKSTGNKRN